MARHDAKGKSKKHFNGSFVGLEYGVMQSPAYRSLGGDSIKLFLDLWTRFSTKDGNNNGRISYSVREAADLLGSGKDKARRCFDELIDRGFLAVERKGAFSVKMKLATTWRITLLATASAAPTRDYQRWRPTPVTVPNTGTENSTEIQNTVPTLRRVGTQNRYRGTKKHPKTAPTVPSTGTETTPNEGLSVPRTGTHLDICHRHSEASTPVSDAVRGSDLVRAARGPRGSQRSGAPAPDLNATLATRIAKQNATRAPKRSATAEPDTNIADAMQAIADTFKAVTP